MCAAERGWNPSFQAPVFCPCNFRTMRLGSCNLTLPTSNSGVGSEKESITSNFEAIAQVHLNPLYESAVSNRGARQLPDSPNITMPDLDIIPTVACSPKAPYPKTVSSCTPLVATSNLELCLFKGSMSCSQATAALKFHFRDTPSSSHHEPSIP